MDEVPLPTSGTEPGENLICDPVVQDQVLRAVTVGLRAATQLDLATVDDLVDALTELPPHVIVTEAHRLLGAIGKGFSAQAGMTGGVGEAATAAHQVKEAALALSEPFTTDDFVGTARGFQWLFSVVSEILSGSAAIEMGAYDRGLMLIDGASGRFPAPESGYAELAALLQPTILFAASQSVLPSKGLSAALPLVDRAARLSENAARSYFLDNADQHAYLMGQAAYYRSVSNWWKFRDALKRFAFHEIPDPDDIAEYTCHAVEMLSELPHLTHARLTREAAEVVRTLLESVAGLAAVLRNALETSLGGKDTAALRRLRDACRAAHRDAPSPYFAASCESMALELSNVMQMHRPKITDFGVYSGLISCAVFVGLFAVILAANQVSGSALPIKWLMGVAVPLSLVAGFGYGAPKFRSLFGFGGVQEFPDKLKRDDMI